MIARIPLDLVRAELRFCSEWLLWRRTVSGRLDDPVLPLTGYRLALSQ